jgi:hypothetical protein
MATRPWATPGDVREYTGRASVKERSDAKLAVDISRAEQYVASYTRNRFDDPEKYPAVPESVKTAVILIAEAYAADAAGLGAGAGMFKSETFDDYSYTAADTAYKLGNLDLGPLLDEYVEPVAKNTVTMRMRRL